MRTENVNLIGEATKTELTTSWALCLLHLGAHTSPAASKRTFFLRFTTNAYSTVSSARVWVCVCRTLCVCSEVIWSECRCERTKRCSCSFASLLSISSSSSSESAFEARDQLLLEERASCCCCCCCFISLLLNFNLLVGFCAAAAAACAPNDARYLNWEITYWFKSSAEEKQEKKRARVERKK